MFAVQFSGVRNTHLLKGNVAAEADTVFDGKRRPTLYQPPQGAESWTFDAFEEVLQIDARRRIWDCVKIPLTRNSFRNRPMWLRATPTVTNQLSAPGRKKAVQITSLYVVVLTRGSHVFSLDCSRSDQLFNKFPISRLAAYDWTKGDRPPRFHQRAGKQSRLNGCKSSMHSLNAGQY